MNQLAVLTTLENGLSFELWVDGKPLGDLIGAVGRSFPYWIVEDGLPWFPPHGKSADPEIRIVCVCSCGDYGCGHARSRVTRNMDTVIFQDFDIDVSEDGRRQVFRFTAQNYAAVVEQTVRKSRAASSRAVGQNTSDLL